MRGWVYIITNKGFDGLVKIGFSERPPEFRAKELGNAGSPYSCTVQYEILVEDPRKIEKTIHRNLSPKLENKEWFRCSIADAIQSVKKLRVKTLYLRQITTKIEGTSQQHGKTTFLISLMPQAKT